MLLFGMLVCSIYMFAVMLLAIFAEPSAICLLCVSVQYMLVCLYVSRDDVACCFRYPACNRNHDAMARSVDFGCS